MKILGYELSRRFSITLRDIGLYERFVKKLLPLENVVNITTEFDRTDRKNIEEDLIAEASRKAREQAGLMAKGFGVKLGPVFAISQRGLGRLGAEFGIGDSAGYEGLKYSDAGQNQEILFVPSTITLRTSIRVLFRLQGEKD